MSHHWPRSCGCIRTEVALALLEDESTPSPWNHGVLELEDALKSYSSE